jgi:dCMP deaminase
MTRQEKWDIRFLKLAYHIADWSKDPSTKVGAVIVDDLGRIASTGYNGLPQKMEDSDEILNNRDLKYEHIIHGEINALIFKEGSVRGFTLYTVPFLPCTRCGSVFIQAGIARVVAPKNMPERWKDNLERSKKEFQKAGIEVVEYDLENFQ